MPKHFFLRAIYIRQNVIRLNSTKPNLTLKISQFVQMVMTVKKLTKTNGATFLRIFNRESGIEINIIPLS